ncbi:hypothetical protein [Mesorhizobium sp. 43Arga]
MSTHDGADDKNRAHFRFGKAVRFKLVVQPVAYAIREEVVSAARENARLRLLEPTPELESAEMLADRVAVCLLKDINETTQQPPHVPSEVAPPSSFWLSAMLPADTSDEIIINMEELYLKSWLPRHGRRRANLIWHLQVAQFILWRWTWPIVSLLGALKLIKLG